MSHWYRTLQFLLCSLIECWVIINCQKIGLDIMADLQYIYQWSVAVFNILSMMYNIYKKLYIYIYICHISICFIKMTFCMWGSRGRDRNHMVVCNRCLSPLTLWVRIPLKRGLFDTTLCDKVCQSLSGFLRVLRFLPPIKLTATI